MTTARDIAMKDGRTVSFGEKQKMDKSHGSTDSGQVFVQIDFDNGETVRLELDPASDTGRLACGHGLSQKLGDSAAGADNTNDAFESILELAGRVAKGEWKKASTSEGGSAKGASELVEALVKILSQPKDTVREMIGKLTQADKMALRKTPAVAEAIEAIKAARAPSKAESDKVAAGAALLDALKGNTAMPEPAAEAVKPKKAKRGTEEATL